MASSWLGKTKRRKLIEKIEKEKKENHAVTEDNVLALFREVSIAVELFERRKTMYNRKDETGIVMRDMRDGATGWGVADCTAEELTGIAVAAAIPMKNDGIWMVHSGSLKPSSFHNRTEKWNRIGDDVNSVVTSLETMMNAYRQGREAARKLITTNDSYQFVAMETFDIETYVTLFPFQGKDLKSRGAREVTSIIGDYNRSALVWRNYAGEWMFMSGDMSLYRLVISHSAQIKSVKLF